MVGQGHGREGRTFADLMLRFVAGKLDGDVGWVVWDWRELACSLGEMRGGGSGVLMRLWRSTDDSECDEVAEDWD